MEFLASPQSAATPAASSTLRAAAVALLVFSSIAAGCGGNSESGSSSKNAESRPIETIEITAAAALLDRARQPGVEDRATLCEQILEDYPESPEAEEALFLLCKLDQNANRHESAYNRYRRLVESHPAGRFASEAHQYLWSYEARIAQDEQAHDRATMAAIEDLRARLEKHPEEWLGASGRTLTMAYLERGDIEGAVGALERQIAAEPSERAIDEQTRVTALFHLGSLHVREENFAEARAAFERGLEVIESNEVIDDVSRDASRTSFQTALAQLADSHENG